MLIPNKQTSGHSNKRITLSQCAQIALQFINTIKFKHYNHHTIKWIGLSCVARRQKDQPAMLRPPAESRQLNTSNSLYLREITARRFWKTVFSFSAEFLKSSGHNDVRKNGGCLCHMVSWRTSFGRVVSSLSVGGWRTTEPSSSKAEAEKVINGP